VLRTGAPTLDTLAYHLVTMGLDFTIDDPPELVDHVAGLADRLARASGRPATDGQR
jgi:hypothetical protein